MEKNNLICISCPMGCHLEVTTSESGGWLIEGNQCRRGEVYARNELNSPTRTLTTTVKVNNCTLRRLPVKTLEGIPKDKMYEAMRIINNVSIEPPVKIGDIIVENILDTGTNVVATRNLP